MIIDVMPYIHQCATKVAPSTMAAIVRTESKSNPLAIGLNRHKKLGYQPSNLKQATSWVEYLDKHGYDFDVGLGQVNIRNIRKYGYKPTDMLDPCKNLQVASLILLNNYKAALATSNNQNDALYKAISAYNTGNYQNGFTNGYVQRVVKNTVLSDQDKSSSNNQVNNIKPKLSSRTVIFAKNKSELQANFTQSNQDY